MSKPKSVAICLLYFNLKIFCCKVSRLPILNIYGQPNAQFLPKSYIPIFSEPKVLVKIGAVIIGVKKDNTWYEMPDDVVGVMVNPINGQLAKESDKLSKIFYFLKGTEPTFNSTDLESVFKENNEKKSTT